VTSNPSVAVCSAILKWERAQAMQVRAQVMQGRAMQWQAVSRCRPQAPVWRACQAARESCACASAHPA
jgi:hypothetical protein